MTGQESKTTSVRRTSAQLLYFKFDQRKPNKNHFPRIRSKVIFVPYPAVCAYLFIEIELIRALFSACVTLCLNFRPDLNGRTNFMAKQVQYGQN